MNNKRILVSLLLVVLVALSLSAVSAADAQGDVLSADANDNVLKANTWTPSSADAEGIQAAIDSAQPGDSIDLTPYTSYDVGNATIEIVGKDNLLIKGANKVRPTIYGHGAGDGIFYVSESKNVKFLYLNFVDNNPQNDIRYNGTIKGWGINFDGEGAQGGTVSTCTFQDFNQAVLVTSCNKVTVKYSTFTGGIATKLINDPTVNKEQGSKIISVGGSFYTYIIKNTFDGPVLDAISIAKGSGDAIIRGNTFKNNAYSIYFGGASTEGTFIEDNVFEKCGVFDDGNIYYDEFPVISIQKASDSVYFNNNTFKVVNNNILIAAESSNTAHGAPSSLGDINVTNNVVEKYTEDVVTRSVTLLHILSRSGDINPKAPITVTGNRFVAGIRPVVVWYNDWGKEDSSNIVIPAAHVVKETEIIAEDMTVYTGKTNNFKVTVKDADGNAVANRDIAVVIDSEVYDVTTDDNGVVSIPLMYEESTVQYVTIVFLGDDDYKASMATVTIQALDKVSPGLSIAVTTDGTQATVTANIAADATGFVKIFVDGVQIDKAKITNGVATYVIPDLSAGSHAIKVTYAGNYKYTAQSKTKTITI